MATRSKKNRLKRKFSGIETILHKQVINNSLDKVDALASSAPDDNHLKILNDEEKKAEKLSQPDDISYLNYVIKFHKAGYQVLALVFRFLSKYTYRPFLNDSMRVISFFNKNIPNFTISKNEPRGDSVVLKNDHIEVKTQKVNLNSIEAITVKPDEKPCEKIKREKESDLILVEDRIENKKVLTEFELDIQNIFHGRSVSVELSGICHDIEVGANTLEFDSTIYEFIAFRLDQTNLNQNINSISIKTSIDEKAVSHTLVFDLKKSGQKWTYLLSKNILSMLEKRITPYQGVVSCVHNFNSTTENESCIINYEHQRIDAYMTKLQSEPQSVKKIRSVRLTRASEVNT